MFATGAGDLMCVDQPFALDADAFHHHHLVLHPLTEAASPWLLAQIAFRCLPNCFCHSEAARKGVTMFSARSFAIILLYGTALQVQSPLARCLPSHQAETARAGGAALLTVWFCHFTRSLTHAVTKPGKPGAIRVTTR